MTYLELEVSLLHLQVGADMLVDSPCKFIVQLPAYDAHQHGRQSNDTGDRNQRRLNDGPNVPGNGRCGKPRIGRRPNPKLRQSGIRIMNLVHLDSRVNKHRGIENTDTNDLDGVLQSKRIVTQNHKKQMGKDEQGEVTI
jgi:hypothetical protein